MFLQRAFPRCFWVNESLAWSAMNATGRLKADAFDDDPTKTVCHKNHRPFCCLLGSAPSFSFSHIPPYIFKPSLKAQIRHQRPRMVIEVLAADAVAISICIISPTEDACIWDVGREKIVEPVVSVYCCPGLVAMSVQSMDGNNTGMKSDQALTRYEVTYSMTGCSPPATTLRPWKDTSTGCLGSEGSPAWYHRQCLTRLWERAVGWVHCLCGRFLREPAAAVGTAPYSKSEAWYQLKWGFGERSASVRLAEQQALIFAVQLRLHLLVWVTHPATHWRRVSAFLNSFSNQEKP